MAALAGLILTAWLVARSEPRAMTFSPDRAAPGHTITVTFEDTPYPIPELTLERGGRTLLLENDRVTDLSAAGDSFWLAHQSNSPSEISLMRVPDSRGELRMTHESVSRSQGDPPHDDTGLDDLDLPPGASLVVVMIDPMPSSVWKLDLPFDLERGTYRACTLPDDTGGRFCAPLTVGFGD
jgi:hypothetical protein